jgi:hypothetical protein
MPRKRFTLADGTQVEDEAIEVKPSSVSHAELIIWEYDDPEVPVSMIILDPQGVRLWKAQTERDPRGKPLLMFEPRFAVDSRGSENHP